MNIITNIRNSLTDSIKQIFSIETLPNFDIAINIDPAKQQFGDLTCNIALILAKIVNDNPRSIAQKIKESFKDINIEAIDIAGPGFINIFLNKNAYTKLAAQIFEQKNNFFKPQQNCSTNYSIEFVSANPTGPLHIGHGRGGILGDVLGNILKFLGCKATKEFYINDAGSQIQKLGNSFKIRCLQQLGKDLTLPEDAYHGEYLIELAKKCVAQYNQELLNKPDSFFAEFAKEHMLKEQQEVLKSYGVEFDVWFSELTLHNRGAIDKALEKLKSNGFLYEKEDALWFKSTEFGDDKDRVVKKQSGELTYVAADIAYLQNKISRGFNHIILILGQDHHSYVIRLKAVLQALGYNPDMLDVILYQLVTLKEAGQALRMSKRAGRIVTLEDVIETVGTDVARFFYLNKKADAHLDFDIELALKHTDENPVFYIQYAYVRINSIISKAQSESELQNITSADAEFIGEPERYLLKKIAALKDLLETTSKNYQIHLLTYYAIELAQAFHSYYNLNKVIDKSNINQSRGRLLLISLVRDTLKTCFDLLGISAPEKM